jgi:hypothetical protein
MNDMPATKSSPKKRAMSSAHKSALAEGRNQGRAVRNYLEAIAANKPKRGRKRTAESVAKQIDAIDAKIDAADALQRLLLTQQRHDLEQELESMGGGVDVAAFEAAFIEVAADYGAKKGISYSTWRASGVPAAVLRAAGVGRGA